MSSASKEYPDCENDTAENRMLIEETKPEEEDTGHQEAALQISRLAKFYHTRCFRY